jgi:hypothetical protein
MQKNEQSNLGFHVTSNQTGKGSVLDRMVFVRCARQKK